MNSKKFSTKFTLVAAVIALTMFMTAVRAASQTETIVYNFAGPNGYTEPFSSLTSDAAGNLYGTAFSGGIWGRGMVYELSPTSNGAFTEKVLYSFNPPNHTVDGTNPEAPVVLDASGNLYGTTTFGGAYGGGTAFKLTPTSTGSWAETILRSFSVSDTGGAQPAAGLLLDAAGNLYGTTSFGGVGGAGTAFELTPNANGIWSGKVIHQFVGKHDGSVSYAGLISDASGNLYGTTCYGGANSLGTVFEIIPGAGGTWSEKTLHSFGGKSNHNDGSCPQASLIFDASGNLYGTTYLGGPYNNRGIAFELSPKAGGGWTETILHDFNNDGVDGYNLLTNLTIDSAGNLYGVTHNGGTHDYGTVFELTPSQSGWTEKILHNFNNDGTDGYLPVGGLILDAAGNLFGTTTQGGVRGGGTAFEITP